MKLMMFKDWWEINELCKFWLNSLNQIELIAFFVDKFLRIFWKIKIFKTCKNNKCLIKKKSKQK